MDIADSPPVLITSVMELLTNVCIGAGQTNPTDWAVVDPRTLAGALPWYKSIPGAATDWEEQPCRMDVAGSSTEVFDVELDGEIEFKGAIPPGNTPEMALAARAYHEARIATETARERDQLLRKISVPTSISALSVPALSRTVGSAARPAGGL